VPEFPKFAPKLHEVVVNSEWIVRIEVLHRWLEIRIRMMETLELTQQSVRDLKRKSFTEECVLVDFPKNFFPGTGMAHEHHQLIVACHS